MTCLKFSDYPFNSYIHNVNRNFIYWSKHKVTVVWRETACSVVSAKYLNTRWQRSDYNPDDRTQITTQMTELRLPPRWQRSDYNPDDRTQITTQMTELRLQPRWQRIWVLVPLWHTKSKPGWQQRCQPRWQLRCQHQITTHTSLFYIWVAICCALSWYIVCPFVYLSELTSGFLKRVFNLVAN
jgi:hypothetical protein